MIEQDLTARPGTLFQLDLDLAICGLTSTSYEGWAIEYDQDPTPSALIMDPVPLPPPPPELPDAPPSAPETKPGPADSGNSRKQEADPMLALGLDGIKRIVVRYEFQGKALLTDLCIEAPAPRKGLVGWLDQPGFRKDRLPPLPRNTAEFAIGSFDPAVTG